MASQNEIEILQNLAKGDAVAFNSLVKIYQNRLLHFSQHYLKDYEMAKDVVQDVFAEVWDQRSKFSEVENLSSWLFTITKYQSLKKIERLKVQKKHSDLLLYRQLQLNRDSLNKLDTSPIVFDEIMHIMQQGLSKLPVQTQKIFEMSRLEKKKNREIADELGVSVKTVEAAITRAIKLLRPLLKQYMPILLF